VADTDTHNSGWWSRSSRTTVLLPTPEGPDRTVSRGRVVPAVIKQPSGAAAELPLEGGELLRTEPADATALRDADLFHDLAGPHLAHAG
jgi:hypothetical protein